MEATQEATGDMGGTLLVGSRKEGQLWLIDLASGSVRGKVATGPGTREIALSPEGTRAAVTNYGEEAPASSLTVVDVVGARALRQIELGEGRRPHGIIWSASDRLYVTSETTRSVLVVDPEGGEVTGEIPTLEQGSHMMAATPDGRRGFVTSLGGAVSVIDLETGEPTRHVAVDKGAEGVAVTPAGELWIAHRVIHRLSVLDARTLEPLATVPCPGYPIRVSVQPEGDRILVACPKRAEVAAFDTRTRREVARVSFQRLARAPGILGSAVIRLTRSIPFGVCLLPGGRHGYAAHPKSDRLSLVDLDAGRVVGRRRVFRGPDGMAWSPV